MSESGVRADRSGAGRPEPRKVQEAGLMSDPRAAQVQLIQRLKERCGHCHGRGVLTKVRQSAGQDVEGGCGQLRARVVAAGAPRSASAGLPLQRLGV